MPTVQNLPAADVQVQFPSGEVKTIFLLRLLGIVQHAEMMARFGHGIARNAPTLREVREELEIPASVCRTWAQAAPMLREFYNDLTAHLRDA